ncbi:MAG: hypothetical protein JSV58_07305 [Candidatus Bathyarchaeota archaeon]|nr:MAG: hypothetical protein JSV58_07305 [Candidatus Bathyarchaeota archaeon]
MKQWLKDLLTIYTWKELWMVVAAPAAVMGVWFLFCFLLTIPNAIVRATGIWSLILTLALGSSTVDALRKQQH